MRFTLSIVFASAMFAQSTGSITGMVADHDGVALPKAAVQATNIATKKVYKVEGSVAGAFSLTGLPAGAYDVQAMVLGLLPNEQKNVTVGAGQTAKVSFKLDDFANLNTLGDGRELIADLLTRHKTPTGPTPRMANGKPDFSGVWMAALPVGEMPQLTALGQSIVRDRQENNLRDIPLARCQPYGITMFGMFLPYRVLQTPDYTAIISEADTPNYRQLFTDGRPHPKNLEPTWMGHSIGHWEGDTLVVDTVGFNGKAWIDINGDPYTEKTHIIERYKRPDLGHLEVSFTIEDSSVYTKPWTVTKVSDLAPKGEEVMEYICTENNKDVAHLVGK